MQPFGPLVHPQEQRAAACRPSVVCLAFRRPTGGLRPPARLHSSHQIPAPDNSACILGRRPDVFNGGDTGNVYQPLFPNLHGAPDRVVESDSPPVASPLPFPHGSAHERRAAASSPTPSQAASMDPATRCPAAPTPASAAAALPSVVTQLPTQAEAAAAAPPAICCAQLRLLHLAAQSMHRRMDAALQDVDSLDLATGPDLLAAERLHKVLAAYVSLQPVPEAAANGDRGGAQLQSANMTVVTTSTDGRASRLGDFGGGGGQGSEQMGSVGGSAARDLLQEGGEGEEATEEAAQAPGLLRALLYRVEAAAGQVAAIGARHAADTYGPLRRFYFSSDEPLLAISLRSEQYRRQLERAVEAHGSESAQVAALMEEISAAMSSRTVKAFLDLEQWNCGAVTAAGLDQLPRRTAEMPALAAVHHEEDFSAEQAWGSAPVQSVSKLVPEVGRVGQLAAAAAADYWSLQELRQELEVVRRSAEAAGVPLGALLRLADSVTDLRVGGA